MNETSITLLEFNSRIKRLLSDASVVRCWVMAELSDVNVRGGHCYMELIQKEEGSGRILAKNRAIIWANLYPQIKYAFESVTGQSLASGIKLMVEVSVNYHEQYGMSLIISNINPEYTLGDMERQRQEIINRLKREGIIDMNKQIEWAAVPQRVAIVSAEGAAGYGDFINQLTGNPYGLKFYTCLFRATMQGERTVPTVMAALDRINDNIDLFDCVVIIRGGGSTSDLHSFDNYDLAAYIAQFPIPVITGIGHERDTTVLDYVAAMRVKTPTAAAEWLIGRGTDALTHISELSETIVTRVREYVAHAQEQLTYYGGSIPLIVKNIVDGSRARLNQYGSAIPLCASNRIATAQASLRFEAQSVAQAAQQCLVRERMRIEGYAEKVAILSPASTLRRGYSITRCDGRAVTDASQLKPGDRIITRLAKGIVESTVEK